MKSDRAHIAFSPLLETAEMARLVVLVLAALVALGSAQGLDGVPPNDTFDLFLSQEQDSVKGLHDLFAALIDTMVSFEARMQVLLDEIHAVNEDITLLQWKMTHCPLDPWRDLRLQPACEEEVDWEWVIDEPLGDRFDLPTYFV
jgi:hypothetical protein